MTPGDPAASDQEVALGADHDSSSDPDLAGDIDFDSGGPTDLRAHPNGDALVGAPQLSGEEGDRASSRSRTGVFRNTGSRTEHACIEGCAVGGAHRHLEQRNEEVKDLIGGVPGFVSYTAFRSGDGGLTITVRQDKTGTDESSRRAAEWVKENISATANPPVITEGSTVVHFNS